MKIITILCGVLYVMLGVAQAENIEQKEDKPENHSVEYTHNLNNSSYSYDNKNSDVENFYYDYHIKDEQKHKNYQTRELKSHYVIDQHRLPDNYQTNSNSAGYYFNFTAPDGTSMSTGGFVNNNSQNYTILRSKSSINKDYGGGSFPSGKTITNK